MKSLVSSPHIQRTLSCINRKTDTVFYENIACTNDETSSPELFSNLWFSFYEKGEASFHMSDLCA